MLHNIAMPCIHYCVGSQSERSQMRYDMLSEQEDGDVILTT